MLKKIIQNKPMLILFGAFIIFAIVNSICILPNGDDFLWQYNLSFDELTIKGENGRYFTNILTNLIVRIPILRIAIMTVFTVALPAVMYKILSNIGNGFAVSAVSIFVIITIPNMIKTLTLFWMSGFTNYVIGAVLSLSYLCFCLPLFNGKYDAIKKRWAVFTAVLGFLGALCVENVTIFNGLFAAFVIVFSFIKYRKVNLIHIVYFISTAAASVLMSLNGAYSSIISGGNDDFGFRSIDFSGPEMMIKVFQEILPYFARIFYILHILIAASVLIMYNKKFRDVESKKRPKYAKLFLTIIVLYAAFSLYTSHIGNLSALTAAYRIFAVETAFTFLYLVGLVYIFSKISSTADFIRRVIFILGAVIVTVPFVVVNPVTPRCFFMTFIFWSLLTADVTALAVTCLDLKDNKLFETSVSLFVSFFCITIACTAGCNKYIDDLRINYIKEQVENNSKIIYIVELPYKNSFMDYCDSFKEDHDILAEVVNTKNSEQIYKLAICDYFDLDKSFLDKSFVWISVMDYYA